ncbi:DUF2922 domain-containing protein [Amphibacillus cookii]|uniref:DUF2922 domain-containing protein n=1 Tax=Amphibacillus cookii TaxID=767787 RepID=UPI00195B02F4|nr:DUF2922 domain-containing protein [Amphibacillus cookii]MBM7540360.1 hypothetical protein [Amphibacillus cookii]
MQTLELKFLNQENRVTTFTLEDPIDPIDPEQVRQVMDQILASDVFFTTGGALKEKYSARIVERYVEDIEW